MMIAAFIISICFLQLTLYWLADKLMLPIKLTILIALTIAYINIFPIYFHSNYDDSGILNNFFKSIMMHYILVFLGIGSIVIIHIAYLIAKTPKRPGA